jgi:hypothetical protein
MPKRRKLLLGIIFIVSITIAFAGGYVIGVICGYDNALVVRAPFQSLVVLWELRSLRNGEIDEMIKRKEDELNDNIRLRGKYYERITPHLIDLYYDLFLFPDGVSKLHWDRDYMYRVAKHRIEYPHDTMPKLVEGIDTSPKQATEKDFSEYNKEVKETLIKELRYQLKWNEDKYSEQKDERTREVIGELRKYIETFEKSTEEEEQN